MIIFGESLYSYINQALSFDFLKPANFIFKDEITGVISTHCILAGLLMLQTTYLLLRYSDYKWNFGKTILLIIGLITFSVSVAFFSLNYPWQESYQNGLGLLLVIILMALKEILKILAGFTTINFGQYNQRFGMNIFAALILCGCSAMLFSI